MKLMGRFPELTSKHPQLNTRCPPVSVGRSCCNLPVEKVLILV